MPIQYTDSTYNALIVDTAQKLGMQKTMEREVERRDQMFLAAEEMRTRRELASFEAQMRTQAAKLSQAWELEKMQRESELDFQQKQKELSIKRDSVLQADKMAKDKYLSYVQFIDDDKTLASDEKATIKRMAYDKMVANIDVAERVYFPESYQTKDSISDLLGDVPAAAGGSPAIDDKQAAIDAAHLQNPQATPTELADAAEQIYKQRRVNNMVTQLIEQSGNTISISKAQEEAERLVTEQDMATTESAAQAGLKQGGMIQDYKPTPYQAWEKFVQGGGAAKVITATLPPVAAARQAAKLYAKVKNDVSIPEVAQLKADAARHAKYASTAVSEHGKNVSRGAASWLEKASSAFRSGLARTGRAFKSRLGSDVGAAITQGKKFRQLEAKEQRKQEQAARRKRFTDLLNQLNQGPGRNWTIR